MPFDCFQPPPPVNVVDDEETNRRYRDAPEAKQKKESDKRKEMGLICVPLKPTTRKYMRKKSPPVPVKAVAEGAAAAPTRAPLAPISHHIVAGRDRAPASTPMAAAMPPAPASSSLEEVHGTSHQPSRQRVARHAIGSSEARGWRIDTSHPRKNRQPQSAAEYLMKKRIKRAMRDRAEEMDLVDLAIAVSATQKW